MSRTTLPLALLLLSCAGSSRTVKGLPGTGDDTAETGSREVGESGEQPGIDSGPESGGEGEGEGETGGEGEGEGETGGEETDGETATSEDEVCYPGESWAWDACFPLVDYDAAWGEDYAYPDPYGGDPQYSAPARYLDLYAIDTGTSVAPNFVLEEFTSADKGQYGLFQTHVVEALQYIRDESGGPLTVNSGYRNVTYNAGVGGVSSSRHMYGDGVDLDSSTLSLEELAESCEDWGADYTQLYEAHVHCDWREDDLDPAFYDVDASRPAPPSAPPVLSARVERTRGVWTAPAEGFDEGEPLRRWSALDERGVVIAKGVGRSFEAPKGTVTVRVVVGGKLTLTERVAGSGG